MRQHLNADHQIVWDRYYKSSIIGGCDEAQAQAIANERTLHKVMQASAAITRSRESLYRGGNTRR